MSARGVKKVKCNFYDSETGVPKSVPCPRSSKICWFIHPNEPEWHARGGGLKTPTSPRRHGANRRRNSSSSRGRVRSRSRSRSRDRRRRRTRSRSRSRSRTRTGGSFVSPTRRRPRPSSPPPRRPLHERIQRSYSPRPRPNSRPRSYSPVRRHRSDRRPRTPTPISSSSRTPPPKYTKPDRSPPRVKLEPSTETVPTSFSNPVHPAPTEDANASAGGDQSPVPPRGPVDQPCHQPLSLDLSFEERATATSTSPQPWSPQESPLSPIFAPETPIVPGFPTPAELTQPQITAISELQKSLESVIKPSSQDMKPPSTPPVGGSSTPRPATWPEGDKAEVWSMRVKLWADLMKAKSEAMEWEGEIKVAQSLKNRLNFDTFSPEVQTQINARIIRTTNNLVQHQLAFEALVSQSIALDQRVSKANAVLKPSPAVPDPRAATPREIEWMQERIQVATTRMDELEKKLALQDQLLERLKAEQEAVAALPPVPPRSPMEVDDGDGVLDSAPSLKRKRGNDDEPRPSSRRRSLARSVADLQEANEALVDRIAEAEGTIEGLLNDVVEDPEGEESSRASRLKEIFQDYQTFIESAKTSVEVTEGNSRLVEALKREAERAIANWNEAYQEFETAKNEANEIQAREKQREEEIERKQAEIVSMQRQFEAVNSTVQAFVEQQSAQPAGALTLEQVIEALKPILAEEMREATRPLLSRKHEELQRMLTDHIEAVRVSIYEPLTLSEQVARTMVTWLEAEFGFGATKR